MVANKALNIPRTVFEQYWALTDVTIGKVLQNSGGRTVCEIAAQEGDFVCKVAAPPHTEETIQQDTFTFTFLKNKGFEHIPTLLKTTEGTRYKTIHNQCVYVMERVAGKALEGTPHQWAQLGEIAAQLHNISDYPYETSLSAASEIHNMSKTAKNLTCEKEYRDLVNSLPDFSELSTSLIHTDIGPHNAIQRPDGVITLTDWDDAGVGTTILDVGAPLICQFVTSELTFEKEKATAFYNAYFAKRNLPDTERDVIFDAGLFFALMYMQYGNTETLWQKITYAVQNRESISRSFTRTI